MSNWHQKFFPPHSACQAENFFNLGSFFLFVGWGVSASTWYCGHFWPIVQPRMIDDGGCGAIGGMRIGRGNRSTRRKPAPVPLCPPQIPHDLTSNPARRGGKPATNRLGYGAVFTLGKSCVFTKIFDLPSLFPVLRPGKFLFMT
jgi:hypothetical protein